MILSSHKTLHAGVAPAACMGSFFVRLEFRIEIRNLLITHGYSVQDASKTKVCLIALFLMKWIAWQICDDIALELGRFGIRMIGNKMIAKLCNLQEYTSVAIW